MVSERFLLSNAKVHGGNLNPFTPQQKPQETLRSGSWKESVTKDKERDVGRSGDGVWDPVRRVERFARSFMLVVFVIFNVIYWITAYAY